MCLVQMPQTCRHENWQGEQSPDPAGAALTATAASAHAQVLTSASLVMKLMPCALQPSDTPFAFKDRTGAQLAPDSDVEQEADTEPEAAHEPAAHEQPEVHRRRPVWQDPDDQTVQVDVAAEASSGS